MLGFFFITGDLKDCCSYVNRHYCETSDLTVICLFFTYFLAYWPNFVAWTCLQMWQIVLCHSVLSVFADKKKKSLTMWAAGRFFFHIMPIFSVAVINEWPQRFYRKKKENMIICTELYTQTNKCDAYSGTPLICFQNHVQVPKVKHSSAENQHLTQ